MNVLSVSQFVEFLNTALATAVFPEGVSIEGEVVEYRLSQQKWIWFKLKDDTSVVDCFSTVWQLRTPLEDGMKVRVHGTAKVHAKSGKFSVNVERAELVGEGALKRAFELLRKKLDDEGLFDPDRKRPLPQFPQRIGLIASTESAAYGDFLRILGNRWGGLTVEVADVAVQGRDAVQQIVGAFRWFNDHAGDYDALVLTRGGGSMEDLQAFNSEEVARAVFGSHAPVIVGVGHERDETLADYAADVRASTPTNAAELLVPERREIESFLDGARRILESRMRNALSSHVQRVDTLSLRIETHARREIDAFGHLLTHFRHRFTHFASVSRERMFATQALTSRLSAGSRFWSSRLTARIDADVRLLQSLDPRRPLERGYALVHGPGGELVTDAVKVNVGDPVTIHLRRGSLGAKVVDNKS